VSSQELLRLRERDRPRVGLRIVDRDLRRHATYIHTAKALRDAQGITMRMTGPIEPAAVVESIRVHHEGLSVPPSDGVALLRWLRIARQLAAVAEDLPEVQAPAVDDVTRGIASRGRPGRSP
jgi:hypothetical protein